MDKWRQYRNSQLDMREAAAISKCEAGDYQAGIPVLEDALITARMPLPVPGYRWPGKSYSPSRAIADDGWPAAGPAIPSARRPKRRFQFAKNSGAWREGLFCLGDAVDADRVVAAGLGMCRLCGRAPP